MSSRKQKRARYRYQPKYNRNTDQSDHYHSNNQRENSNANDGKQTKKLHNDIETISHSNHSKLLDTDDRSEKQSKLDDKHNDEDSKSDEELAQYQVRHHTPELKPDPKEMVEEDLNETPEWMKQEDSSIVNNDFNFSVIDKEADRKYFEENGSLPDEASTITVEEYQRRHNKPTQQISGSSDSSIYGKYRDIVVRLDEDINKITTYIQQTQHKGYESNPYDRHQLNRYQKHLQKLINKKRQYDDWWMEQMQKENIYTNVKQNNYISFGLKDITNVQHLEQYKDYYSKQLKKMIGLASTDPKYNDYVDYYKQKLEAVEKRHNELSKNDNDDPFEALTDLNKLGYTKVMNNQSYQQQKLKAYIRQHALRHVDPPPHPTDEKYPHWYHNLRRVENIIYAKYINKQQKH